MYNKKLIEYKIYNPAGNLTAFVTTVLPRKYYKAISKTLLNRLKVEQIGFLERPNTEEALIRIQMMGGELCGNALASIGLHLCEVESGSSWIVETSGTSGLVTVDRYSDKDTFRVSFISRKYPILLLDNSILYIEMEGISHFVVFINSIDEATLMTAEHILEKVSSVKDTKLATGIVFALETGGMWEIVPYIYVRGTDSFIQEKGCSTGTVALATSLRYLNKWNSDSLIVKQPSQHTIRVNIKDIDQQSQSIELEVPVIFEQTGTIEVDLEEFSDKDNENE